MPRLLTATDDVFGGVVASFDGSENPCRGPEEFTEALRDSLAHWRAQGKAGIWLRISLSQSHFVPPAAGMGFVFHHAEPQYVMMTRWLPDTESTIPANASHSLGVGAFVLNDDQEVLVVKEKNGPLKGLDVWKMPTGLVSCGEGFAPAAEREVLEETGVSAAFEACLATRQGHGFAFGKSDMFMVCALRATSRQITVCEVEIEDAKWMPLEEYLQIEFFQTRPIFKDIFARCAAWARGEYAGWHAAEFEGRRGNTELLLRGEL